MMGRKIENELPIELDKGTRLFTTEGEWLLTNEFWGLE